jgi:hypothetical protein
MKRDSGTELMPRPARPSAQQPDRVAMLPGEGPAAPRTEQVDPAPAERAATRPTERASEMPRSGVERKSARRVRNTIALGDALAEVERSFKIPKDAEERILKVVLARVAAGRAARANRGVDGAETAAEGTAAPREPASGIKKVTLADAPAAHATQTGSCTTALREPTSGITRVTLADAPAAHATQTERQTPGAEDAGVEHVSYRRTRVPSRVVMVTVAILALCILAACLVLRRV